MVRSEGLVSPWSSANRRSRGQTITEFALVAPVLFLLLFGILESGLLLFSVGSARFAAGECARQESESGNAANADTVSIGVVNATALGQTKLATVQHIDIQRQIQQANGTLAPDGAHINSYQIDGTPIGAITWPPSSRDVINGQSDFLGVTIYYRYTWKTGLFIFSGPLNLKQSFYIRLEPQTY
jgi:Flp pilus assembly protein TadG